MPSTATRCILQFSSAIAVIAASSLESGHGLRRQVVARPRCVSGIGAYTSALLAVSAARTELARDPGRRAGSGGRGRS